MADFLPPSMIAASIAGAGIGFGTGFVSKGEELENIGASAGQQVTDGLIHGFGSGIAGAGIGLGISGTGVALKSILGKK